VRPSRAIAVFALVALTLLRGVGMAADAWTANAVECCCGRHAADHDCGCAQCPSHHHGGKKHHQDDRERVRACGHSSTLAAVDAMPEATAPPAPPAIDLPHATEVIVSPHSSPSSRVVHPETPPS
jgi:hypothetical protein